jgi:dihydroorotate dehydrogenase (fumarate)
MDLSTKYLGFTLPHPFMMGSSPLADDLDMVRRLEDAGTAAIVLRSLFEEQIVSEEMLTHDAMDRASDVSAEATYFFPRSSDFAFGPSDYLEHLRKIKSAVGVPVFASLNGIRLDRCVDYALQIEQAGADALELNLYFMATRPEQPGSELEDLSLDTVRAMRAALRIPIAVKISPFYTSILHFARSLDQAGANGVILFNRFYQPDIDIDGLEMRRELRLSDSSELLMRIHWLALVHGQVTCSLGVTGGVHTSSDAIKAIMTGASAVQMVSAIFRQGPTIVAKVREEVSHWLEAHEYESLGQLLGSMNFTHTTDPSAYERANYMHVLRSWKESLR